MLEREIERGRFREKLKRLILTMCLPVRFYDVEMPVLDWDGAQ